MSKEFQDDLIRFNEIFHRGVEKAIAENERLGLSEDNPVRYPTVEKNSAPLVSEDES